MLPELRAHTHDGFPEHEPALGDRTVTIDIDVAKDLANLGVNMADSLIYQEDHFVVLETNQPEQFLTAAEMLEKLRSILAQRQEGLPPDLQKFSTVAEQAQHLIDTACDLEMEAGQYLQWYAVRLEK
jgi:hypothetical protein